MSTKKMLDQQTEASPSPSPVGEESAPKISEVEPKKTSSFLAGILLGFLFGLSIPGAIAPIEPSSLYEPLFASLVGLLAIGLGVLMFTKGQEKFRGIAVASLGALWLLIGGVSMNTAQRMSAIEQEAEEFSQFLAEGNELSREILRQTYAQGMELLEEKDYEEALAVFEEIAYVDPNYENLPELVKEANEALEAQK